MKYIIIISLFLFSSLYADIPAGYYDSASGLSGESLKLALHNIIDDHTEFTYSSIATDTWDILKETDRDPDNADNVILLYTGWSRVGLFLPLEFLSNKRSHLLSH